MNIVDPRKARFVMGVAVGAALVAGSGLAQAEGPNGCTAFKWPLAAEAAKLQAPRPISAEGTAQPDGTAYMLDLHAIAEAALPHPPERAPKLAGSKAGFVRFGVPAAPGFFQIALSHAAWIDVIQDDRYIKPVAVSGVKGCLGVRKSIRFNLGPAPFVVQISGTDASSIALMAEPVVP